MNKPPTTLELRSAPLLHTPRTVEQIMRHVVYALLPLCAFAVYAFGLSAAALIGVVTVSCVGTEQLFNRLAGRVSTLADNSAVITGLLLALTLPPGFPLWMGTVAGFIAIGLGKAVFGGLGGNIFNPALVGRAFVQAAFPVAITTWHAPFMNGRFTHFMPTSLTAPFLVPPDAPLWYGALPVDTVSGATPLALHKFEHVATSTLDLFLGTTAGSLGETSAILILLCGAYLAARRLLNWRIPVAVLASAFAVSVAFTLTDSQRYPDPWFMLGSGGLMLGAFFMATDPVGAPVTPRGAWLYGALIGAVTVMIRLFGGLPEGVMYAILLGNAATPLIEAVTQPRVYGTGRHAAPDKNPP
jgi:electron transport complex protein RnfD